MSSGGSPGQDQGRADDTGAAFSPGFSRPGSGPASPQHAPSLYSQGRSAGGQAPTYQNPQQGQPSMTAESLETGAGGGGGGGVGGGGLSMGSLASSLPNYRQPQPIHLAQTVSRLPPGSLPNLGSPQHPSMLQFAGQTPQGGHVQNPNQPMQYIQSYPHMQQSPMQQQGFMPGGQGQAGFPSGFPQHSFPSQPYPSQQQPHSPAQPYMFFPPGYNQMNPAQGFQGSRQSPNAYSGGGGFSPGGNMGNYPMHSPVGQGNLGGQRFNSPTAKAPIPSAPRGPPRKPKQSGYALWVGNLPPGALVQDLKDHFSREATNDIESVFLISKSNCAFVNYRTETACAAAMTRFHDSRFQGVRLVCRSRSVATASPTAGAPSGPAAQGQAPQQSQSAIDAIAQNREVSSRAEETMRQMDGAIRANDKYFVVKSLTVEDLELSARNGIWATQAHNEEALNKAFESVGNVYLIFSANKSGEYFGYARMVSPINDEAASKLEWKPRQEVVVNDPELPRSIPTPATETAPKGRIIDDSARGTIFWEVDTSDEESDAKEEAPAASGQAGKEQTPEELPGPQTFGRPFKIEWISTERLPFYRTRGLRNPWNGNRDVKIARDGTELETNVGRRLVQMFHRSSVAQQPLSPTSAGMGDPSMGFQGMPQF